MQVRQTSMTTIETFNCGVNTEFIHRRIIPQAQSQEFSTRNGMPRAPENPQATSATYGRAVAKAVAAAVNAAVWAGNSAG